MSDSDTRVSLPHDGMTYSLLDDQEYTLGHIPIRIALAKWQGAATHIAEMKQRIHSAREHRQVRALFEATTLWRLCRWHKLALEMYRDPQWARQRFWRLDLQARLRQWSVRCQMDPVVEYEDWPDDLGLARIINVTPAPRAEGQIGRTANLVTFFATDGSRGIMVLKDFRQREGAEDLYRDFIAKRKRPTSKKQALETFLRSKSLSQFRSRASSRSTSNQNSDSDESESDGSVYSDEHERDRMVEILKHRLGSESVDRSHKGSMPRARQSTKVAAVKELKQQMETLSEKEAEAQDNSNGDRERRAEEVADLATIQQDSANSLENNLRDQLLKSTLAEAQVSTDLEKMLRQSAKMNQTEEQTRDMGQRLAENEQQVAELKALLLQVQSENKTTVHVRQYQNKAEMELEKELDKITEVHAEHHRLDSDLTYRTCLVDGCQAEVLRGKKMCTMGHPVCIRQLKCPWPGCGAPCSGSVEQQLNQPICYECERPLIHSQKDDRLRLQLMKDVKEAAEGEGKYDKAPKGNLKTVLPDSWQITEAANNLWRTLRLSNSSDNYLVAEGASTAYEALEELVAASSTVPESMVLGTAVDFNVSVRAITAAFSGKIGRNMAFQIYELAQTSGCSQDRTFLKWKKDSFKDGQFKEPNWDDPAAAVWLQHYLDAVTTLLRHTLSSQVAEDHDRAVKIFMTAYKKEGSRRVRFTPRMIYEKHAVWIAQYFRMGEAFVNDMSYFDKLYGDKVLWNNPGTHMQAPKLVLRWFDHGVPVWDPVFDKCFDEPMRQVVQQEALKAYRKEHPDWQKLSGTQLQLEGNLPRGFRKQWLERNDSNLMVAKRKSFKWPDKSGNWVQVTLEVCFACLQSGCEVPKCSTFHNNSYRAGTKGKINEGVATLNLKCFAQAIKTAEESGNSSIGSLSTAYVAQLAKWRKFNKLPKHKPSLPPIEEETTEAEVQENSPDNSFVIWMKGEPQPRPDVQQPQLNDFEAKWVVGSRNEYQGNTSQIKEQVQISMVIPAYSSTTEHRFSATAYCVGEEIKVGKRIERRRCLIKVISYNMGVAAETMLASAKKNAQKFIEAGEQIRTDYAHLNHVEFGSYWEKLKESYHDVAAPSQESSLLWLKNGWLDLLNERPIALWTTEGGRVQLKILMLAADENRQSRLDSKVSHVWGHEGHAYSLKWEDGLDTLQELLTVSSVLCRYGDIAVELCLQMKDTLQGETPEVPEYLRANASFMALVNATAEGYIKLAGSRTKRSAADGSEAEQRMESVVREELLAQDVEVPVSLAAAAEHLQEHDLTTSFCTSCKKHKEFHHFKTMASGRTKNTCEECLSRKRAKHKRESAEQEEVRRQHKALDRSMMEAAWKSAWMLESMHISISEISDQQSFELMEKMIDRLVRQHIKLQLTESQHAQRIQFEVRNTTDAEVNALKSLLVSLTSGAQLQARKGQAAVTLQQVQEEMSILVDQLQIQFSPQAPATIHHERYIQTLEDLREMQALGASYVELERARVTGVYGFFCACPHGTVSGTCEQVVPAPGLKCLRCSQYSNMSLPWFNNVLECRCHCCSMCHNDASESEEDGHIPWQAFDAPEGVQDGCQCRQYVLGQGWTSCTNKPGTGSDWCEYCSDAGCECDCVACAKVLRQVASPEESQPTVSDQVKNTATQERQNSTESWPKFAGHEQLQAEGRNREWSEVLDLVLPEVTFSFAELMTTMENGSALLNMKPPVSTQQRWMGSATNNLTAKLNQWAIYGNFSDSTEFEIQRVLEELATAVAIMEWRQLVSELVSLWSAVTYSCKDTMVSHGHRKWSFQKFMKHWNLPLTSSHCITSRHSLETWTQKIEEFQLFTRSDTWSCSVIAFNSFVETQRENQLSVYARCPCEYVTLNTITNWAYAQGTHRIWLELWPKLAEIVADRYFTQTALDTLSISRILEITNVSGIESEADWDAHFEIEAWQCSAEMFKERKLQDSKFDLDNLSPSLPRMRQRDYSSHPLVQLKREKYRRQTAPDEANEQVLWVSRMLDRFPPFEYRRTHRKPQATERLSFSVSHSSMDTEVSSSVSPERYHEAAGFANNEVQQALPVHLQLPSQAAINKTFTRTNQSKLTWASKKMRSEAGAKCERCEIRLAEKNEFCSQCWQSERAECLRIQLGRFQAASTQLSGCRQFMSAEEMSVEQPFR